MTQAPPLEAEGYVCTRCDKFELHLSRLLSARVVEDGRVEFTHTCPCAPGIELKGRYVPVPDLMYRLFRERLVRLPWTSPRGRRWQGVGRNHPAVIAFQAELDRVRVLDDIPGVHT